ncbi:hypothetical protein [Streptococcus oricebi]|uniref:Phage protein n=1 Tax=Streptococcus oricebi TaxID=1547447 RepID=A0ABS5B6A4_9STRE|nr:hypothetical protein [Streptococcus oricebi]MBP2624290.1 hypothetical protein [Streptococcus oricebi]
MDWTKIFFDKDGIFQWQAILAIVAVGTPLGYIIKNKIEKRNKAKERNFDVKLEQLNIKRKKLDKIYSHLIKIADMYPNQNPYDILEHLVDCPRFHFEGFDTVNRILDIQIEEYKKRLKQKGLSYDVQEELKIEIRNREYYKKEIIKIRDQYFQAKEEYELFKKDEKSDFDLYAGQKVKNALVHFDVLVNNAFIAGTFPLNISDRQNRMDDIRWELKNSIRDDLGMNYY